ncbi:MAG: 6-carboxytetrahydropterin synthase [Bryobacteraceae bacterium]|nr:6-carboxytetrahydropterin synthase [Bryobacteraceae bacterium]
MRLTRRYPFSASHRLHSPALSDEQNREIFGKCNHPFGHGHDYVLEVSVQGQVDAHGRVAPIEALDRLVNGEIVSRYHQRNLNLDIEELAGVVPTTEVLAAKIRERLAASWPAEFPKLDRIRIFETERNIFEIA